MCHLLLLMPVLALPVFWLLPWPLALSTYAVVTALSAWLYWLALRAMRRPVVTGREELIGSKGEVAEAGGRQLSVRVHGEVWNARSKDRIEKGDRVQVDGMDGLILRVSRIEDRPPQPTL
jgi:inner membrane protein